MKLACLILSLFVASGAIAETSRFASTIDDHVIAGYVELAAKAADLNRTAQDNCAPTSPELRAAYNDAFDAWLAVSHLRFGPSEVDDRAFALAFWPDSRGVLPKTLSDLIRSADPIVESAETFAAMSIAARGFYAMEFLLYDADLSAAGTPDYHCSLVQAVARDIQLNAEAIRDDWQGQFGDAFRVPGSTDLYRTDTEVARQLFTALSTGLEFTAATRLGRPLGTFERPRPARAEAWRSERSLRHVILSLRSLRDLAAGLSDRNARIDAAFAASLDRAESLDDPVLAGVSDPITRFRIEALQQTVEQIRTMVTQEIGPDLGVSAGFNSADGD